ncbi:hypothetical protein MD484_g3502, partial [Candolleomyces efflorescens]
MGNLAREASWVEFEDYFDGQPPVKPGAHGDFAFGDDDNSDSASPTTEFPVHNADLEERWMNGEISLDQLHDLQAAQQSRASSLGPLEGLSFFPSVVLPVTRGGGAVNAPRQPSPGAEVHSAGSSNQHVYPLHTQSAPSFESGLGYQVDESGSHNTSDSECSDSESTATATDDDQEKLGRDWAYSHCALDPNKWATLCPICAHVLTAPEGEDRQEYFPKQDAYFFTRDELSRHILQHIDASEPFWTCPLPVTTPSGNVKPKCRVRVAVKTKTRNESDSLLLHSTTTRNVIKHIFSEGHRTLRFGYPLVQRNAGGEWFPDMRKAGLMPDLQCKYCSMTFKHLWARDGRLAKHLNEEHPES